MSLCLCFFRRLRRITIKLRLLVEHLGITSALGIELCVCTVFYHMTVIEHGNLVRKLHSRKTVCNQNCALAGNHLIKLGIDLIFGIGIQSGGRLVQNENIFVMISCTCNRDSLPLPAGGLYGFFIVPFISEFHYIHY